MLTGASSLRRKQLYRYIQAQPKLRGINYSGYERF